MRETLGAMAQGKVTQKDCIVLPVSGIGKVEKERGERHIERRKPYGNPLWMD